MSLHISHTAAIAAGNNGIPVRLHGHEFGKASGMAPRARWRLHMFTLVIMQLKAVLFSLMWELTYFFCFFILGLLSTRQYTGFLEGLSQMW